jgi:UDPglucose 6-dehydrogenase
LLADGAKVHAYDPVAEDEARKLITGVELADTALGALEGADACIIVTEWPEFAEIDWRQAAERMRGRLVIDGRNLVDPEAVRAAGFTYEGIGR